MSKKGNVIKSDIKDTSEVKDNKHRERKDECIKQFEEMENACQEDIRKSSSNINTLPT